MSPNLTGPATGLFLAEAEVITTPKQSQQPQVQPSKKLHAPKYTWHIVWRNVLAFVYLHVGALYGLYLLFTATKGLTVLWTIALGLMGGLGITAGAHRLWAHKAYKAKWPLRVFLMICQTIAFQNHIYEWVRDHRVHHKFTDTDADPHNSRRGFFFSHIGWLMVKKHDDVKIKGKQIDMSDLERDWVVMFQKKYYLFLVTLFCFILPTWIPIRFWNEAGWTSWYVASIFRYTMSLNNTWLVNSAAHMWGTKPYDKTISPSENLSVAVLAFGEGWHNFHHAFPWDYKTSEFSGYRSNITTAFIDLWARMGLAYQLKTTTLDMIEKRAKRSGDGSRFPTKGNKDDNVDENKDSNEGHTHSHEGEVWGWDDKDLTQEDKELVKITH
ncbi:hypothetical protein O3M35_009151 [Rhynocoris fuscipes]